MVSSTSRTATTKRFQVRCTEDELNILIAEADKVKLATASFTRMLVWEALKARGVVSETEC